MHHVVRFVRQTEGVTAIEYGLISALIAAVIVGALTSIGSALDTSFGHVESAVTGP